MYRVLASIALVFVVTLTPSTFAQQGTSEIGGRVADEQGAVLPGVSIVLTHEDSGVFRAAARGRACPGAVSSRVFVSCNALRLLTNCAPARNTRPIARL